MFKGLTLTGLAFAGIIASGSASAELVSADDGFAVYDTETSTFWMNLSETAGLSLANLNSEMGEGGKYDGWRLADTDEIFEMWSLNVEDYISKHHLGRFAVTDAFKSEWRSLFGTSFDNVSSGFYYDGSGWRIGGVYRDGYPVGQTSFFGEDYMSTYNSYVIDGYDYYGYYLVYDGQLSVDATVAEDVPLPFLGMGALGLLGLGFSRKRST